MRKWIPSILICSSAWGLVVLLIWLRPLSVTKTEKTSIVAEYAGVGVGVVTKVDDSSSTLRDAGLVEILVSETNTANSINVAVLAPLAMNFQKGDTVKIARVEHYHAGTIQTPQFIAIRRPPITK